MAMPMPRAPGYVQMMKEGTRHYSGLEEAVVRNIEACVEFSKTLRSAYGPRGLNKMVINHIEKLFVTNDAATIISQLDVQHPAAKMMVMASQMQEQEVSSNRASSHFPLSFHFPLFFFLISHYSLSFLR